MNNLQIIGAERHEILDQVVDAFPAWRRIDNQARRLIGPRSKREVWLEQGAVIAYLASQYNRPDARILEIGACFGYSAAIMKLSAPEAVVVTLEPSDKRHANTSRTLKPLGVSVFKDYSADFLADCTEDDREFDFIFVDGDHANIALDLPYWNLLKQDGLFLHHDYSPEGSKRECRAVWDALNHFSEQLGHQPDVLVQDTSLVGMAGWYRRDLTEVWPPEGKTLDVENGYVVAPIEVGGFEEGESEKGITMAATSPQTPGPLNVAEDEPIGQDVIDDMREAEGTLPTDEGKENND